MKKNSDLSLLFINSQIFVYLMPKMPKMPKCQSSFLHYGILPVKVNTFDQISHGFHFQFSADSADSAGIHFL
jgi:hypothetical protein